MKAEVMKSIGARWFAIPQGRRILIAVIGFLVVVSLVAFAISGTFNGIGSYRYHRGVEVDKQKINQSNANTIEAEKNASRIDGDRQVQERDAVSKEADLKEQRKRTAKAKDNYYETRQTPLNLNRNVNRDDERRLRASTCENYPQLCDK